MRELHLHDLHAARGAAFREAEGYRVPARFADTSAEVGILRASAGVVDHGHRGRLAVGGADRARFLDRQATAKVASLAPGQGTYATFLTGKGKLRGHAVVLAEAERYLLGCEGDCLAVLRDHLAKLVLRSAVKLEDLSSTTGELGVHGPRAREAIEAALDQALPALEEHGHATLRWRDRGVTVARFRPTGEDGYELIADAETTAALWAVLVAALHPVGYDAMEVLRIEAGRPRWGVDMGEETFPIEAGLIAAIDYDKGCFPGYEVMARIRTYGHVNRHLAGLTLVGEAVPQPGATVRAEAGAIGTVTSACRSERVAAVIALAMIRREVAEPGTALEVEIEGVPTAARVVSLPFAATPGLD